MESDSEHTWTVTLSCMLLAEALDEEFKDQGGIDTFKVIKMALIHDLPEIITGDFATWDDAARTNKEEDEQAAMQELTKDLPEHTRDELRSLWHECEAMETLEAKIVKSIDRMDPVMQRVEFGIGFFDAHDGSLQKLDERQYPRHEFSQTLTLLYNTLREEALKKEMFKK